MSDIIKSLGKRKGSNLLIVIQVSLAVLYFFISAVSVQEVFYTSIMVPKQLDSSPEKVIHIEVQSEDAGDEEVEVRRFEKFRKTLQREGFVENIATYHNSFITSEVFGNEDIPLVQVENGAEQIKKILVENGRGLKPDDFEKDNSLGSEENPIPLLIGKDVKNGFQLQTGSRIIGSNELYYEVVGIMEEGSTWFFQTVSEGQILSLDHGLVAPKIVTSSLNMHYYGIASEGQDSQKVLERIRTVAQENDITLEAWMVSQELEQKSDENLKKNIGWLSFAMIILVMIAVGTAIIIVARLYARHREIGIRVAVGYSMGRICLLMAGEVLLVGVLSFVLALAGAGLLIGTGVEHWGGMVLYSSRVLSGTLVILGGLASLLMCLPSVAALVFYFRKLQPNDLIGGRG